MPFLYFTKNSNDIAQVKVTAGTVSISNEVLIVTDAHYNADFAIYARDHVEAGITLSDMDFEEYLYLEDVDEEEETDYTQ